MTGGSAHAGISPALRPTLPAWTEMTPERIARHFAGMASGPVELYPLDNLLALKIVLNGALSGGAARSLRSDNLGKCAAAALLRMEIETPPDLVIPAKAGIQKNA